MSLIDSLPEIDKLPDYFYVVHEKFERLIPVHYHNKGQLSYVEGGLAYVIIGQKTYVIPARHYFWIPQGVEHVLKLGHSATVLRNIFFNIDSQTDPFYHSFGIYPINELLLQMIKYTEKWEGAIGPKNKKYYFLDTIRQLLPEISTKVLPIALPSTENERMVVIMKFLDDNIAENHTLESVSKRFALSDRSLSRLFKSTLGISFLQYLKLLRMVKAFEMILQNNNSMTYIAESVGYQSLSAFSNTFYQVTNLRPSDFIAHKN